MSDPTDKPIEIVPAPSPVELEKSISSFSQPLARFLQEVGLPTENVLSPIEERKRVIYSLEDALSELPIEEKEKAHYLTKFTVAISVGLFDGALNYLWDETIKALRTLILNFDLEYFFSITEEISSRYRSVRTAEDLDQISDHDLLEACRRIGLLTDVNYRRLENINYMRNHASAAHPNENELGGYEMVAWLSQCLKYAITAEPDHSVISIKQLLTNIRTVTLPVDDFPAIGEDIPRQPQERVDDLLRTLFGMYVDPRSESTTKSNISHLAPYVWNASTENKKYELGAKYGVYRKNGDTSRREATQEFLEFVDGERYKDEDSLAGELIEKLETLRRVHFGMNNFYNEYPHAKALGNSLPPTGDVPRAARSLWVKVIGICYIGNGHGYREGVDEGALPYYQNHIDNFSEAEIVEFLRLMGDAEFTTALTRNTPDRRIRSLAKTLKEKTSNIHIQRALDLLIEAPAKTLYGLHETTKFKEAVKFVPGY